MSGKQSLSKLTLRWETRLPFMRGPMGQAVAAILSLYPGRISSGESHRKVVVNTGLLDHFAKPRLDRLLSEMTPTADISRFGYSDLSF